MKLSAYQLDVVERVLWTAAEATVAVAFVHVNELDPMYVAPATAILSLLKAIIAKHVGDKSAALPLWMTKAVTDVVTNEAEVVVAETKKRAKKS